MKQALLSLLAAWSLAHAASGAEKIEGAFGFTLGQKFEPTTPIIKRAPQFGFYDVFQVDPPVANGQFVTYYVHITPITHQISKIIAVGKSVDGEAGVEADLAIKAYLQAKYGDASHKFAGEIRQDQRVILVGGAQNPGRTITDVQYIDGILEAQGVQEQAQLDAAEAAEHARRLLTHFDGAGL